MPPLQPVPDMAQGVEWAFEILVRRFGQVAAPDATISRFAELPGVLETLV